MCCNTESRKRQLGKRQTRNPPPVVSFVCVFSSSFPIRSLSCSHGEYFHLPTTPESHSLVLPRFAISAPSLYQTPTTFYLGPAIYYHSTTVKKSRYYPALFLRGTHDSVPYQLLILGNLQQHANLGLCLCLCHQLPPVNRQMRQLPRRPAPAVSQSLRRIRQNRQTGQNSTATIEEHLQLVACDKLHLVAHLTPPFDAGGSNGVFGLSSNSSHEEELPELPKLRDLAPLFLFFILSFSFSFQLLVVGSIVITLALVG
ncbi:hypothetical protein V8C26DRAFT_72951 [Trichoderma gracile]